MSQRIETIVDQLDKANTILLATHVFPDADALGSQLALGNILEAMGKKVVRYGEEPVTHLYSFLPGSELIDTTLPEADQFDCAISLDCGDAERLGREKERILGFDPLIVIDHHRGNKTFGDINWVDSQRAATGEMVYDLAIAMGADISYEAAYCLYTAIVSDTGSFKYSCTTSETFRVARELLAKGVKPAEVAGYLYDNFSVNRLKLLQEVLATLEFAEGHKIAIIHVTEKMFERTGTSQTDTENFVNYPRSLIPVKVAVFIKTTREGGISVSMRSKGCDCDVAQVAGVFGGGGHCNAAGFRMLAASISSVRDQLLEELGPMVRNTCRSSI